MAVGKRRYVSLEELFKPPWASDASPVKWVSYNNRGDIIIVVVTSIEHFTVNKGLTISETSQLLFLVNSQANLRGRHNYCPHVTDGNPEAQRG